MRQLRTSASTPRRGMPGRESSKSGVTDGFRILDVVHYDSQRARAYSEGGFAEAPARHVPPEWVCQFELDGHYYNLSPLFEATKELNASFVLEDVRGGHWDSEQTRYDYFIGFCQDVHDFPEVCRARRGGGSSDGALENPESAAVYQVSLGAEPNCHRLGSVSRSWSFGFLDHRRPSQGIRLTYETGDVCNKRVTSYDKSKGTTIEVRAIAPGRAGKARSPARR